jgi:hypothetical protein
VTGGIEPLKHREPRRPRSALHRHRATLEAEFRQQPPATVVEAAARIEVRTGIARKPTQVRQFLPALGMQPRQGGRLPAKADVEAQETLKKTVWSLGAPKPRRANGSSGSWLPHIWCLPPSWGVVWCFTRLLIKAPSGRQRVNGLAAFNAITHELSTVENLTYSTAETVCE